MRPFVNDVSGFAPPSSPTETGWPRFACGQRRGPDGKARDVKQRSAAPFVIFFPSRGSVLDSVSIPAFPWPSLVLPAFGSDAKSSLYPVEAMERRRVAPWIDRSRSLVWPIAHHVCPREYA